MRYLAVLPVLALTIAACSDVPGGVGEFELAATDPALQEVQTFDIQDKNPLLGVWKLTSFANSDGEVEFPEDFSLILTFTLEGEYTLAATNTSGGFVCEEPQTSCTIGGTYTYTATTPGRVYRCGLRHIWNVLRHGCRPVERRGEQGRAERLI